MYQINTFSVICYNLTINSLSEISWSLEFCFGSNFFFCLSLYNWVGLQKAGLPGSGWCVFLCVGIPLPELVTRSWWQAPVWIEADRSYSMSCDITGIPGSGLEKKFIDFDVKYVNLSGKYLQAGTITIFRWRVMQICSIVRTYIIFFFLSFMVFAMRCQIPV